MKKRIILVIQVVISAGLLFLILRNSNVKEIVNSVEYVNSGVYLLGFVLSIIFVIINAIKWSLICRVDVKDSIQLTYISQFYATILPGQVTGEAVKIVYAKEKGIELSNSTASVLLDKATSFVAIFFLGLVGILLDNKSKAVSVLFLGLITASFFAFLFYKRISSRIQGVLGSRKNHIFDKIGRFFVILDEYMKKLDLLLVAIVIGLVCQMIGMFSHFCILNSVGISIPFYSLMWIYAFLSIALFIPISIGGLGVREASYIGFLGMYGISGEVALAGSLLIFSITILNALLGGAVTLGRVISDWRRA